MVKLVDGFVEIKDVKIHYIASEFDDTKTTLLFVPGIMMPAWIWGPQLEYFSKEYNVVAMEPRSHGESTQSSEGNNAYTMAQDIKAVVDALKLESFVLFGWSLGVPQVVNYAVHFAPTTLKALVLVDGIVGVDAKEPFYQWMVEFWGNFQMDRKTQNEKFIKAMFKQSHSDEFYTKLADVVKQMPTNTVMNLILNYILQDFRPLLSRITVPTFIATVDSPRLEYMRTMQTKIPNCKLEIFQEAGHALFIDQPEKFNRSLEAFLLSCR